MADAYRDLFKKGLLELNDIQDMLDLGVITESEYQEITVKEE
ncbi:XkdX family protein [Lactobacillus curvatus]|nr:XkdX family protein [Latilactobacillus curvatus]MSD84761.1 XkdX family protein [Latilactobacillus curvatus]MSE24673.1 XkdX family protein [Latilactobacillus curvatus]